MEIINAQVTACQRPLNKSCVVSTTTFRVHWEHHGWGDVEVGVQALEVSVCTPVSESGVPTRPIQSDIGCGVLLQDNTRGSAYLKNGVRFIGNTYSNVEGDLWADNSLPNVV